jgi:hypothetical protein
MPFYLGKHWVSKRSDSTSITNIKIRQTSIR